MRSRAALFVCGVILLCGLPIPAQPPPSRTASPAQTAELAGSEDTRAVVLFFIATDCPISNRYLPEMERIEKEFAARRVRFWFVYPNVTETASGIRAHRQSYPAAGGTLTDPEQKLAQLTRARTTPEAAVLVRQGTGLRTVYTGRIDDRYLSFGIERPAATKHDLEAAVTAVLAGRPVVPPGGPAVGCSIVNTR